MRLNYDILNKRVAKARSIVQALKDDTVKCTYKLGKGGFYPQDQIPTRDSQCDCSGWASWLMGISRKPKLTRLWWVETTKIWQKSAKSDTFVRLSEPVPGSFAVYPDRNGKQGHIGLVTRVERDTRGRLSKVYGIDCAPTPSKVLGRAITERDFKLFFARDDTVYVVLKQDLVKE